MRTPLDHGWTLRAGPRRGGEGTPADVAAAVAPNGEGVPATVPGTVHTDLLAAGLVEEPYAGDAEARLAWIGRTDWRYGTTLTRSAPAADERVDLVLDGLDTVAAVEVNGEVLARTANMHRSWRVDLRGVLREGANDVRITFDAPVPAADAASLALGARPHVNHHPYNALRKMACSFGWDWGPDLATSGMWRDVGVHSWRVARLASVRPVATVEVPEQSGGARGRLAVHVDVERAEPGEGGALDVDVSLTAPAGAGEGGPLVVRGQVRAGAGSVVVEIDAGQVEPWWPVGHGAQPRYGVDVTLVAGDGPDPLDTWSGRVGFRSVVLDTSRDTEPSGPHGVVGSRTTLVVNGRPLFVKGANWIPDDAFPHRVTRQRYAARADQALGAGVNLLRVWGGGIFEGDAFYDVCDERGLLVVQDFLFACAAYAEEEPLRSEVEAEVRDNVARLSPHPSLALWSGCNENLWGHEDWGWKGRLDGRTWGAGYYYDLLPRVVAELSPHVPYAPGSPFSSPEPVADGGLHPNDEDHGTVHLWEQWNQRDYTTYREHAPRFAAEYGWQGPPTMAALRGAVSDDPLTPESPGMLTHQKAISGNDKLTDGLVPHFRVPDDVDDWHWAMSLNQARAVGVGVEHFRSLSPHCSGSILWQLNDCWPVTSWSVVDGDGRAKPAWYALRAAHADRLLTIQPRPGGLTLVVVNDTDEAFARGVEVVRATFDGVVGAKVVLDVSVDARATVELALPVDLATPQAPDDELVVAQVPDGSAEDGVRADRRGARALWFFVEDRDAAYARQDDALTATVHPDADGYRVDLVASALVRDVAVLADRLDPAAVADEMLVTLLAGESASIHVASTETLEPSDLTSREVLRSANQLMTDVRQVPAPTAR